MTVVVVAAEREVLIVATGDLMAWIEVLPVDRTRSAVGKLRPSIGQQIDREAGSGMCTVGIEQEAARESGDADRFRGYRVGRRLPEDIVVAIGLAVADVATGHGRVWNHFAALIDVIRASIVWGVVGEEQDFAKIR